MAVDNLHVPVSAQRYRELQWTNRKAETLANGAAPGDLKEEFDRLAAQSEGVVSADRLVEFARANPSSAWHAPLFQRPEEDLAEERRLDIADTLMRSWKVVQVEIVGDKRSEVSVGKLSMPKVRTEGGLRGRMEHTKLTQLQAQEAIEQRVRSIGYQIKDLDRYSQGELRAVAILKDVYEELLHEVRSRRRQLEGNDASDNNTLDPR